MFPVLSRDGGTLGIGAYRNFDRDDAIPGEANLLVY